MHTDDDVGLHVLGCRVDILGTNCNNVHTESNVEKNVITGEERRVSFTCGPLGSAREINVFYAVTRLSMTSHEGEVSLTRIVSQESHTVAP